MEIKGKAAIITQGGFVKAGNIGGDAEVRSQGGTLEVGDVGGNAEFHTTAGQIRAGTIAGSVTAEGGRAIFIIKAGYVKATTNAGDISIGDATRINAKTAGGTITSRRVRGPFQGHTESGDIRLDTRSGKVTKAGEPVKLTAQEYKLLSYLMHHKGKVVSRTELIEHIYDQDFDRDSNTIEVFVTRIRKKLGPDVITTIRGLGYSLEEPEERRV